MTQNSTLPQRPQTVRKFDPPEPQVRLTDVRKERLRRRFARRIAAWAGVLLLVYWCGAFLLTHLPMPKDASAQFRDVPNIDKLVHLSIYTGLALLLSVWLGVRKRVGGALFVAAAVMIVLGGYATFDELSQASVGRQPDIRDWFADFAGVNFGLVGFFGLRKWVRR